MSVRSDAPDDFTEWCRRRDPAVTGASFVPRTWYGSYLRDRLAGAAASAPGRLELHTGRVTSLRLARGPRPVAVDSTGRERTAERVVLAAGHASGDPAWAAGLRHHPRYVSDPWAAGALDRVPVDGPVLLVGTGLTAVDTALTLSRRGADLIAVSRHGLLPHSHVDALPGHVAPLPAAEDPPCDGIAPLMRHVRRAAGAGPDWRTTVDALRPAVNDIWQRLSPQCRERFLRHAARYWEVHRHRMAPPIAAEVAVLVESGRLRVRGGRVVAGVPAGDRVDVALAGGEALRVAAVVNCTGPGSPLRQPLVRDLVHAGSARAEPLGLGLDVDPTGRLLDADGLAWPDVQLIGPARRGRLWETTAVPEIRAQAESLAAAA
jgi:uncharacterized NAD(P)/FAD-binding protein YdhS